MDLADVGQNVSDGCHIASMGGTWMVLVYGFAGIRDFDGRLTFRPRLPKELKALKFPLSVRGRTLEVAVDRESAIYTLRAGPELVVSHWDEEVTLAEGVPVRKNLPGAVALSDAD